MRSRKGGMGDISTVDCFNFDDMRRTMSWWRSRINFRRVRAGRGGRHQRFNSGAVCIEDATEKGRILSGREGQGRSVVTKGRHGCCLVKRQ